MSYYVLLSQHFDHFLLNNVYCNIITMYHNIFITTYLSNTAYNVKFSERKKKQFERFFPFVECSLSIVIFSKIHI